MNDFLREDLGLTGTNFGCRNGGRSLAELREHIGRDTLVGWA